MPKFTHPVKVEEFITKCTAREIEEIVELLKKEGWLKSMNVAETKKTTTISQLEFDAAINKIYKNRLCLTNEEEDTLKNISSRL